jgi:hypothetical protein
MSTPTSSTPFVGAELEQLMLLLSRSAYADGRWQPLPGESFNVTQLADGLALVLNAPAPTVAGAVFVAPQAGAAGQLYLSAAAWHTLMLNWPQDEVEQLTLLAAGAVTVQKGAAVVSISLTDAQWTAMSTPVAQALGLASGLSVPELLDATPPAVTDLDSLHAAIAQARNDPGLVLLERAPLDESNRYAHFAIAVNRPPGSEETVLLSRALFESIRAIWPEAVDLADADILGGANPIGVVRLNANARGGQPVADWIEALVQRGVISAGQVVYTDLASDPVSLADFNYLVRRNAFPSSFQTPSPGSVVMGDAQRTTVLAASLAMAGGRVEQAAAWLDLGRQALEKALEEGVVKDGWIALDAETADLINPALWPARNAVLLDALRLGGQVRQTVTGMALSGQLDRALASDEIISVLVGDTVYSSAQGGGLTVNHLHGEVENLRLLGDADLHGTGNSLDNTIEGNAGHNTLDGGAGADTLKGGLGNDTYVVDNAGDVVTELTDEGHDTVQSSISQTLGSNVEDLVLTGTAAINGTGNALANTMTGNAAANTLVGGAGNDTYVVDNAGDVVTELAGGRWPDRGRTRVTGSGLHARCSPGRTPRTDAPDHSRRFRCRCPTPAARPSCRGGEQPQECRHCWCSARRCSADCSRSSAGWRGRCGPKALARARASGVPWSVPGWRPRPLRPSSWTPARVGDSRHSPHRHPAWTHPAADRAVAPWFEARTACVRRPPPAPVAPPARAGPWFAVPGRTVPWRGSAGAGRDWLTRGSGSLPGWRLRRRLGLSTAEPPVPRFQTAGAWRLPSLRQCVAQTARPSGETPGPAHPG